MEVQNLIPKLRFPEFKEGWEEKKYNEIYSFFTTNSFSRDKLNYENGEVKNIHYGDIHTKFSTLFDSSKELVPYINTEINLSRIKEENYLKSGDLLIADASEDYSDIGKTIEVVNVNNEKIISGLHTFHARPNKFDMSNGFTGYLVQTWNIRKQVMKIAQGSKVLSLSTTRLGNVILNIPIKVEQQKIATFLTAVDKKITQLQNKKALLQDYKKGLMQQIFSQELRFQDDEGAEFPDWEEKELKEVLDYLQPTKYLVSSTEYDDSYKTPVLTAGKTFILGYTDEVNNVFSDHLPVILFDDFTTATQFVDFPFKAKSSAMKILVPREGENIKFIYEVMQMIEFITGGHGRHWISKYSVMNLEFPCKEEQTKIANFLSAIDKKIGLVNTQLEQTQTFKKGLLQGMFV